MFAGHDVSCPYEEGLRRGSATSIGQYEEHARASPSGRQREQAPAFHMTKMNSSDWAKYGCQASAAADAPTDAMGDGEKEKE